MSYHFAIFDFDGTLADSFPWFLGALGPVARRHGLREIGPEEAEALRQRGTREILQHLRVPLWKIPALTRDLRAMKAAAAAGIPLFDGVRHLLPALVAEGRRLAIVSSDVEANIRRTLGPETAAVIGQYACGASIFGKAPKLRQVLREARMAPAEAIYIGDETRDAEAAAEVGIAFGAVTWGYAAPQVLRALRPAHVFEEVPDILRLLGAR